MAWQPSGRCDHVIRGPTVCRRSPVRASMLVVTMMSVFVAVATDSPGRSAKDPDDGPVAASSVDQTFLAQGRECTPLKPTRTRLVDANGRTVSPAASIAVRKLAATEQSYTVPSGETMTTIIPPVGFLPQEAAPATARAFGFDAPDDPIALAAWRAQYRDYRGSIPSMPCIGRRGGSVRHGHRAIKLPLHDHRGGSSRRWGLRDGPRR